MGLRSWAVTLALCLVFAVLGAFWVKAAIFPGISSGMNEAVPPVEAVAILVFLLLVRGALALASSRLNLSRRQIITVYAFVTISVAIGGMQFYRNVPGILAGPRRVMDPKYPQNDILVAMNRHVPAWLSPTDAVVINDFWHKSPEGRVPWGDWAVPLLCVGGIIALFYLVVICMLRLFHARWSGEERLAFPVAEFALEMVDDGGGGRPAAFRNRLFWLGAVVSLLLNLRYAVPALSPTWHMSAWWIDLSRYFTAPPFNAMGQLLVRVYPPVHLGLAFLVPIDVLFSIWVCTLMLKAEAVVLCQAGLDRSELLGLSRCQGVGGYIAFAALMVWMARRHIMRGLRSIPPGGPQPSDPAQAGRWTMLLLIGGIVGLVALMVKVGMFLGLALIFVGLLLTACLVTARMRAQAGVPNINLHLIRVQDLAWLAGGAFLARGGMAGIAALAIFSMLAHAASLVPHHADCMRMAERSGLGVRRWMIIAVLGVVVGLALANLTHMTALYEHGALNAGTAGEGYMTRTSTPLVQVMDTRASPDRLKLEMAGAGAATTVALAYMRRYYWFPIHPIGFLAASVVGSSMFFPVFLAWLIKWLLLKYFGGRAHSQAKFFFVGLALSHLTIAAIWAGLAVCHWGPTTRYYFLFW